MRLVRIVRVLAHCIGPGAVVAWAQAPVAVRELPPATASGLLPIRDAASAIELRGGRLFVADRSGSVYTVDSTLTRILDTVVSIRIALGTSLVRYHGDSILIGDIPNLVFKVFDPAGVVARIEPIPGLGGAGYISGSAKVDLRGAMFYQGQDLLTFGLRTQSTDPPPPPNSAPVLRVDPVTRRTDTVAVLARHPPGAFSTRYPNGVRNRDVVEVVPQVDAWAMLPNGTIAIVRWSDYHIDWIRTDGSRDSSPSLAGTRRPTTAAEKDSLIAQVRRPRARMDSIRTAPSRRGTLPQEIIYPTPDQLPDMTPAFDARHVIPDLDGNLWILSLPPGTISTPPAPAIYDVVNSRGVIIDRVRLPVGAHVIGFTKGVVYYSVQEQSDVPTSPFGPTVMLSRISRAPVR